MPNSRTMKKPVNVFLNGAKVTADFREALFNAAARAGKTPGEYALLAAAEKLTVNGTKFCGIFRAGDFAEFGSGPIRDSSHSHVNLGA